MALVSCPDDADQTLEFVMQRLMDEYHRRTKKRQEVSDGHHDRALNVQSRRNARMRQQMCYNCRKSGHFRNECPVMR